VKLAPSKINATSAKPPNSRNAELVRPLQIEGARATELDLLKPRRDSLDVGAIANAKTTLTIQESERLS